MCTYQYLVHRWSTAVVTAGPSYPSGAVGTEEHFSHTSDAGQRSAITQPTTLSVVSIALNGSSQKASPGDVGMTAFAKPGTTPPVRTAYCKEQQLPKPAWMPSKPQEGSRTYLGFYKPR
ncbi:hypothetical protein PspLS_08047 [Pyricularia sp. CBS 133598]|nr:hypothetical protein PspLS_08047 [Pyricularia sp. CBS 133598]